MTDYMKMEIDDTKFRKIVEQLSKELANPRMVRRILSPSMRVLVRGVVAAVTSPPRVAAAVRPTIGFRLKSRSKHLTLARIGFGLRHKTIPHSGPGVGIGYRNVHWPVLGTAARETRRGAYRGSMPAYYRGILEPAVSSRMSLALQKVEEQLKKEVLRIEKGGM